MSLKLYYHPLASYCWKALIALHENGTAFEPVVVDLGDAASREAFFAVWPVGKFPVIRDEARGSTVAEATIVIDYLDAFFPGATRFVPAEREQAWQVRMWDRVFDNYVHEPMQRIVGDRLRPEDKRDPHGVAEAVARLNQSYALLEEKIAAGPWAMGEAFSLVDCAAAPALFYANVIVPFGAERTNLAAYLDRLTARPSFARVLEEAEPYFQLFPLEPKPVVPRRNVL